MDEFLRSPADEPEPPPRPELGADDVADLVVGTAKADTEIWLVDAMHPDTHAACWPSLKQLLAAYGHRRMDNGAMLSPNRWLTRQIGAFLHRLAAVTTEERLPVAGLRFESSLVVMGMLRPLGALAAGADGCRICFDRRR
jgi:hypothetical protein